MLLYSYFYFSLVGPCCSCSRSKAGSLNLGGHVLTIKVLNNHCWQLQWRWRTKTTVVSDLRRLAIAMPDGAKELHQNAIWWKMRKWKQSPLSWRKMTFFYIISSIFVVIPGLFVFLAHIPICRVILSKRKKEERYRVPLFVCFAHLKHLQFVVIMVIMQFVLRIF